MDKAIQLEVIKINSNGGCTVKILGYNIDKNTIAKSENSVKGSILLCSEKDIVNSIDTAIENIINRIGCENYLISNGYNCVPYIIEELAGRIMFGRKKDINLLKLEKNTLVFINNNLMVYNKEKDNLFNYFDTKIGCINIKAKTVKNIRYKDIKHITENSYNVIIHLNSGNIKEINNNGML